MNVNVSFSVKAQVRGAEMVPTTEEFSEAVRDVLVEDFAFDEASVYDVAIVANDEVIYDVKIKVRGEDES